MKEKKKERSLDLLRVCNNQVLLEPTKYIQTYKGENDGMRDLKNGRRRKKNYRDVPYFI